MEQYALEIVASVIVTVLGIVVRNLLNQVQTLSKTAVTEKRVKELIEDKFSIVTYYQEAIEKKVDKIDEKLDRLLNK